MLCDWSRISDVSNFFFPKKKKYKKFLYSSMPSGSSSVKKPSSTSPSFFSSFKSAGHGMRRERGGTLNKTKRKENKAFTSCLVSDVIALGRSASSAWRTLSPKKLSTEFFFSVFSFLVLSHALLAAHVRKFWSTSIGRRLHPINQYTTATELRGSTNLSHTSTHTTKKEIHPF